jgi:acyl dehydratase
MSAAVDEILGPGNWLTIDQYLDFADATSGHRWIHIDLERAAGPHGATIAHGYLMQSLIPRLAAGLCTIQTGSARISYGSNTIRFPTPAAAGSRVRATASVRDCRSAQVGAFLTVGFTIEVEGHDRPACVAKCVTLVVP